MKYFKHSLKFAIAFVLCLLLRLIPFRPANFEPIMGTMMPFAKRFGPLAGGIFAVISMVIYDLFTSYGAWTWYTAITYGVISVWAGYYFQNRTASRGNFLLFSLMGTLVFDALTGPIIPSLFFHGHFMALTIPQIPFTLSHLAGNTLFAVIVSPIVYKYLVQASFWELPVFETTKKQPAK
jgi:uncharacterized membrane protein